MAVCTLIDNEYASLLFSQTGFSYCFCMLSDFAKVFERKIWRVQVAHLHNAARALSSPSRCQQILAKISLFRYLWYCDKNGLAWHWWNSTDLGLIDIFLINLNAEIVACILSFRKLRHKPNLENTSKYGFSPDFGGKNGGVLSMRMQVILDSSFARLGSVPIWGGKKGEFRDWTTDNIAFLFKKKLDPESLKGVCWRFFFYLILKFVTNEHTNTSSGKRRRNKFKFITK